MIATRNRLQELVKTLQACREQTYPDTEIHVVDDGSTDGTFEAVRARFPEVVISRNDAAVGSVVSRNQIFSRVRGDVLIGFDDDSRFIEADSTTRVVDRFRREPDLGLIEFQDIGPEYPDRISPDGPGRLAGERHVASFGAGRYALRREALDAAGTFAGFFGHAYEEPDLAVRVWDRGFRCIAWHDVVVWHEFSALNRDERRTHYQHARNELLSCLMRCPAGYLVPLLCWRMARQLRYSFRRRWWTVELSVWRDALRLAPTALKNRRPVHAATFRRCLLLNRRPVADAEDAWALGR